MAVGPSVGVLLRAVADGLLWRRSFGAVIYGGNVAADEKTGEEAES